MYIYIDISADLSPDISADISAEISADLFRTRAPCGDLYARLEWHMAKFYLMVTKPYFRVTPGVRSLAVLCWFACVRSELVFS